MISIIVNAEVVSRFTFVVPSVGILGIPIMPTRDFESIECCETNFSSKVVAPPLAKGRIVREIENKSNTPLTKTIGNLYLFMRSFYFSFWANWEGPNQ
jgi:hypothetical protein